MSSVTRVLLVDDDRALLAGLQRLLGFDYELTLASSGAQALDRIESSPPFHVVITDMRMPLMNGIQLIRTARPLTPDSTFVMLTGNQDLGTAVNAVNQSHVFRFINKPCDDQTLRETIDAARRQYDLVHGERELLNKTCAGAVSLLNEILQINQPEINHQADRLNEAFLGLLETVGVEPRWEFTLAARLALCGFCCLDRHQAVCFLECEAEGHAWHSVFEAVCLKSGEMVSQIPRLERVGDIIAACPKADLSLAPVLDGSDQEVIQTGAALLKVAILWDALECRCAGAQEVAERLKAVAPSLHEDYLEVIECATDAEDSIGMKVSVDDLRPGMVLHSDACTAEGIVLQRAGSRLSEIMIEDLRRQETRLTGLRPVIVREGGLASV